MALRVNALAGTPPPGWRIADGEYRPLTKGRARVATVLADGRPRTTRSWRARPG